MSDTSDTASSKHLEKLIREKVYSVCLVDGSTITGEAAYVYVAVPMDKMEDFAVAQQKPNFTPANFGTILASGMGKPSDVVMAEMESKYSFNHKQVLAFPDKK